MPHPIDDVDSFHERGDINQQCDYLTASRRFALCDEELNEVEYAIATRDLGNIIHEFIDLAYVALGSSIHLVGPEATQLAWDEVSYANLSKVAGGVKKNPQTGKIQKPENWQPADVAKILSPYTPKIRPLLPGAVANGVDTDSEWNSKLAKLKIYHPSDIAPMEEVIWKWSGIRGWVIENLHKVDDALLKARLQELAAQRNLQEARAQVRRAIEGQ